MVLSYAFFAYSVYVPLLEAFGDELPCRLFYFAYLVWIISMMCGFLYFSIHLGRMVAGDATYRTNYAFQHTRRMWLYRIMFYQKLDPEVEKLIEKDAIELSQNLRWYHYLWVPDMMLGLLQEMIGSSARQ